MFFRGSASKRDYAIVMIWRKTVGGKRNEGVEREMPMEIYHEYKIDANKLAIGKTKYRWQKMVHNFLVTFVFKTRKGLFLFWNMRKHFSGENIIEFHLKQWIGC